MIVNYWSKIIKALIFSVSIFDAAGLDLDRIQRNVKSNFKIFQTNQHNEYNGNNVLEYFLNAYVDNKFSAYLEDQNVLVYVMNVDIYRFGNVYGHYIEAKSCAFEIGAHFLAIPIQDHPEHYFESLDTKVVHKYPMARKESLIRMSGCVKLFPWEKRHARWTLHVKQIERDLNSIMNHYMSIAYPERSIYNISIPLSEFHENNLVMRSIDISSFTRNRIIETIMNQTAHNLYFQTVRSNLSLPLIPDVSISIRCSDVLHMWKDSEYGFLNFNTYVMNIPIFVKYIYILTESTSYNPRGNEIACRDIIRTLIMFLTINYPNATIAVLRSNPFESLVIRKESKYCICTASTFCFWAALSNTNHVYFPLTMLLLHGKPVHLTEYWNWIPAPRVYQFNYKTDIDRNRSQFEKVLTTLIEPPTPPGKVDGLQYIPY